MAASAAVGFDASMGAGASVMPEKTYAPSRTNACSSVVSVTTAGSTALLLLLLASLLGVPSAAAGTGFFVGGRRAEGTTAVASDGGGESVSFAGGDDDPADGEATISVGDGPVAATAAGGLLLDVLLDGGAVVASGCGWGCASLLSAGAAALLCWLFLSLSARLMPGVDQADIFLSGEREVLTERLHTHTHRLLFFVCLLCGP